MSETILYGVDGSPYVRSARLGLEEKGVTYDFVDMSMAEMKQEPHLSRQPFGRIPAFEHKGFALYETQAILRYVDTAFPGAPLQPTDPRHAARMNQIIGIVDWYVFPAVTVGIVAERLMSQFFWGRPADETNIAAALPKARTCIRELERLKGTADFMTGEQLSLADLMLVPHMEYFRATAEGAELLKGTSLEGWLTRMGMRASMQATQAEHLRKTA